MPIFASTTSFLPTGSATAPSDCASTSWRQNAFTPPRIFAERSSVIRADLPRIILLCAVSNGHSSCSDRPICRLRRSFRRADFQTVPRFFKGLRRWSGARLCSIAEVKNEYFFGQKACLKFSLRAAIMKLYNINHGGNSYEKI